MDEKNLFLYCRATVQKDRRFPPFNWLKYDIADSDENSRFLDQFNAGEVVEIYIKRI